MLPKSIAMCYHIGYLRLYDIHELVECLLRSAVYIHVDMGDHYSDTSQIFMDEEAMAQDLVMTNDY